MEMKDSIFYAELILGEGVRVSARPSDSIAPGAASGRTDPVHG